MLDEALNKCVENNNYTIYTSMCKAQRILMRSYYPVCSISGGSDSDIVLDLIHKVDEDGKVKYFWIDTGLEYSATKEHLDYLEQKYGITIERVKPDKPIPTCVKQYGVPFLSKYVSEQMMRLQAHGFQWENEPLEVLLKRYPRCKTALQWWCGERYSDEDGVQKISRFSIYRNRFLKEFIMQNPPDFSISNKCCEYAKKKPSKRIVKEHDADLDITGIRQAEGGIRSAAFKTCFSVNPQCIRDFRSIGIEIQEGYGITECAPLLAANPINRNKVGSVGPAVQNVTVKIDREKPTDETGEILAKGPNVMLGYCDMPEETAAVFTEDGFFRTGDIGYTDKDGYIYITGRKKNVIILSHGKNVFPEELEEHLSSVPLFLESAVVGRTDSKGETVITAVIYPDYNALKDKTEEEIEAILRNQLNEINRTLPQYKQMRGLEIRKTEFEKTTSRKIKRYKI